ADDPLALARDYVSKGLMDVAAAEAVRAVQRGADKGDAAVLVGDIFAKRGLHGEALDRYREARALDPQRADALLGEVKALFALGGARAEEARGLAEHLLTLTPDDVDALVAVAKGRAAAGDAAGALTALQQAQTRAPGPPWFGWRECSSRTPTTCRRSCCWGVPCSTRSATSRRSQRSGGR